MRRSGPYPPRFIHHRLSAFTRKELQIVIVIIAVFAFLVLPLYKTYQQTKLLMDEQARRSEAHNEVKQIANAISSYELEYSKLPFPPGNGGEGDLEMNTFDGNMISILSGYNVDGLNPRKKPFYTGKRAKGAKTSKKPTSGVFGTDEQLQLADPWGRQYYIKIDSNYDNILEDLPGAEDEVVRQMVAVWTKGKMKDQEELPKNKWIKSW